MAAQKVEMWAASMEQNLAARMVARSAILKAVQRGENSAACLAAQKVDLTVANLVAARVADWAEQMAAL